MKILRTLFIVLFLAMLYFPVLNNKLHLFRKSFEEKMPVAPSVNFKTLDQYPKQAEDFFNERLEIKPWLVSKNSKLKIKSLGVSPVPEKVIIGKDGWLYMANCVDDYRGSNLFSIQDLEKIKLKLDNRALYLRNHHHAKFYLALFPLKHSIYPEFLPSTVKKVNPLTRTDQICDYLRDDTLITVINVRNDLIQNKSQHILYYKSDNHWNGMGGYFAYHKIAMALHEDFPVIVPVSRDFFTLDSSKIAAGGEANMMNANEWYREVKYTYIPGPLCKARPGELKHYPAPEGFPYPWDYEIVRETKNSLLPDALIIRDSFSDALLPFLAENFNHSTFIFDSWKYGSNYNIADQENPDAVLYLILESNYNSLLTFE